MDAQYILHCRNVSLVGVTDPLQVRNKATGFGDDKLPPPSQSGSGFDGSVDAAVPVPVAGNKVHIFANNNTAIVYLDGVARDIKTVLHVNITRVRQGLSIRDERVQSNNLLAMTEKLEVVCFNSAPGLSGCECRDSQRSMLK